MRFLVDEDVPVEVARCLREEGHEVFLAADVLGVQTDDVDIWEHAVGNHSIVVTCNRQDFLELAGKSPETGLIVLKRRKTRQAECGHILQLIAHAGEAGLKRNINFA